MKLKEKKSFIGSVAYLTQKPMPLINILVILKEMYTNFKMNPMLTKETIIIDQMSRLISY